MFPSELPKKQVSVQWDDNLRLIGYQFNPPRIEAGESSNLYLAWEILGYTALNEKMFLQLLDSRGQPVGQQEVEPISRKMYRWRDSGLILEQHPIRPVEDLDADLYFVRFGFFDPATGQRLPTYIADNQPTGSDELIVGPLYVSANGIDPTAPQHYRHAWFGREFLLQGYTLTPLDESTIVKLYWQSLAPTDINYTIFVQLLDSQNQIVAQTDAQPLQNIYPTSRWQPGDILAEQFVLPISVQELFAGNRLVTGMYDLSTGARLPVYNSRDDLLSNDMFQLEP
ncbi:MAG: hypothetical protein D6768_17060 [Chloroflexi bacterium]|nr:MAG: hypothetical protein D6768_17060 [Chloroflexota bacterium]